MKRINIVIIYICIVLILLSSCKNSNNKLSEITLDPNYYSFMDNAEIIKNNYVKKLNNYDTPVSICFLDNKGLKHLYVFSCPIRYLDKQTNKYVLIDDRIDKIKDEKTLDSGYLYKVSNSDITNIFPDKMSNDKGIIVSNSCSFNYSPLTNKKYKAEYKIQKNFLGKEKNIVLYKNIFENVDLTTYPTLLGTENVLNKLKPDSKSSYDFLFKIDNADVELSESGYIFLLDKEDKNKILGIIQPPIAVDSNSKDPKVTVKNNLSLKKKDDYYAVNLNIDKDFLNSNDTKYPVRINMPVEIRREKQPDTQVYSNFPDSNAYLSNYSLIGKDDYFGEGQCYLRFAARNVFDIGFENIVSSNYYTYSLNNTQNTSLSEVEKDWCSMTTTWNFHPNEGGVVSKNSKTDYGEVIYNITEPSKRWFDDPKGLDERFGLLLKSEFKSSIFLSNDSADYVSRAEFIFK